MTLTIELTPEQTRALREAAAEAGLEETEYAQQLLASELTSRVARTYTARQLLQMPASERSRYLQASAELAAPIYEADLALPPSERELTAMATIAGRDFIDDQGEEEG